MTVAVVVDYGVFMVDDLGGRLVQAGLVTREMLSDVLGSAPPHEGALVEQLAETGLSQDGIAGYFVAEGFGPLMTREDLLGAEPNALARVPASMAVELLAVPIHMSPAGLVVAMAAPSDLHAVSELARAAEGRVLPTVARVDDLRVALRTAYPEGRATERPMARDSDPPVLELVRRKGSGYQGSTRGAERVGARATVGPEIMPEDSDAFVPLVRTKAIRPAPMPSAPTPPKATPPKTASKTMPPRAMPPEATPSRAPTDEPRPSRSQRVAATPSQRIEGPSKFKKVITRNFERIRAQSESPVVSVGEGTARATWEKPDPEEKSGKWSAGRALVPPAGRLPPREELGLLDEQTVREERPERPRSIIPIEHQRWELDAPENRIDASKLDRMRRVSSSPKAPVMPEIGGTLAAIRASSERDEVVSLACDATVTVCRAAVLLTLRKSVLKGWAGTGDGVSQEAIRNLWIPTSTPSVFRDVVRRREPYRGPPGTSAADGLFRAALGSRGGEMVLQPVAVGGKLVAVLAADDLAFGDDGAHRVEELARAIAEALERIIVDRKRR